MAILDAEVPNELLSEIKKLALQLYGDSEELSQAKVVESALCLRLLWFYVLSRGKAANTPETEEPLTQWEFHQENDTLHLINEISQWLFRREER